jgi:tetratricopeptide (TPR) repeat protein
VTAPLRLSYDDRTDRLVCLDYNHVDDGIHPDAYDPVCDDFAYVLDGPEGPPIGFMVLDFVIFDPDAEPDLWNGPRFDCPALGLRDASAGAICAAAAVYLDGSTLDRLLFWEAVGESDPEEAVEDWRHVIEAGDLKGHFGVGYTLFELGRFTEAYMHLRTYTDIAPYCAWGWNWRGQAALAVADIDQARECFERTLEVEEIEETETDAVERLAALEWSA